MRPPWSWSRIRRVAHHWIVRDILFPFLLTRLLLAAVGWIAMQAFADAPVLQGAWELKQDHKMSPVETHLGNRGHPFLNMFSRWDGGWYVLVAKGGYRFEPGLRSNAAFAPAYPMAIRLTHGLFRGESDASWFFAGLVVSNIALLLALVYLIRIVRLDADQATASRAALYLLVFPSTLFLSAFYAESLFLFASLAAFYHARRNQWLAAGLFGAITALTRPPGFLIAFGLAVEYLAQRNFRLRQLRPNFLWLGLIPAAFGGMSAYFHFRFGNMFAMRDAQAAWGGAWGTFKGPLYPLLQFAKARPLHYEVVDTSFAILGFVMTIYTACKLRISYGVYAVTCFLFLISWGSYESIARYVLIIFPMFLGFAAWGRNEVFHRAYLIIGSALAALFMAEFAMWRWVA
jgi:Gpi18-like mannosyltransferase